jgi:undecaprenyl-diphosphatase
VRIAFSTLRPTDPSWRLDASDSEASSGNADAVANSGDSDFSSNNDSYCFAERKIERSALSESAHASESSPGIWQRARGSLEYVDGLEAPLVKWVALKADKPFWRTTSRMLDRLGNGWLYLGLAILTLSTLGEKALRPDLTAVTAAGAAFLIYFPIKQGLARQRPCDRDPTLACSVKALDLYSCPSGHCMTVTAVSFVFASNYSKVLPLAIAVVVVTAWTKLVLAHHYLSDLILGAAIGSASGFVIVRCVGLIH